jgi:hypothetical protein
MRAGAIYRSGVLPHQEVMFDPAARAAKLTEPRAKVTIHGDER